MTSVSDVESNADLRSAPGEYAVDLFIDGIPSGTYKFILK
jgi:hypothetical protein